MPKKNDSSTGGYLTPSSVGGDLNDAALAKFFQQIVVGIVGLPGPMVRPRWQAEPPDIPDFGTNWAAIGPGARDREPFSAQVHKPGSTIVIRNRTLEVLCSFYGPLAETNTELLAQGLEVAQNREVMQLAGFNLTGGASKPVIVPVLIKQRWQYRVDTTFTLRQQQQYTYPILDVDSFSATLTVEEGTKDIVEPLSIQGGYGVDGYGENGFGN